MYIVRVVSIQKQQKETTATYLFESSLIGRKTIFDWYKNVTLLTSYVYAIDTAQLPVEDASLIYPHSKHLLVFYFQVQYK